MKHRFTKPLGGPGLSKNSRFTAVSVTLSVGISLLWPSFAFASDDVRHHWVVLETPHFLVHYYQGEVTTARRFAACAENAFPRLAQAYGVTPTDKIPIIIDGNSFFNGSAEPIKDRITLDPILATSSVIGT